MINIDWGLVKLQYELFGATEADLATEYDTTERMVKYVAEEQGWCRASLALTRQEYDPSDNKEILQQQIEENLQLLSTIRSNTLNPRYIALEASLLNKSLDLLKNMPTDDPSQTAVLKVVAEVLKSLKENSGGNFNNNKQSEQKGVKILIQNQVGTAAVEREAVTVSIDNKQLPSA